MSTSNTTIQKVSFKLASLTNSITTSFAQREGAIREVLFVFPFLFACILCWLMQINLEELKKVEDQKYPKDYAQREGAIREVLREFPFLFACILYWLMQINLEELRKVEDQKCLKDDFMVHCRNKECTYWFNNHSILVTKLVMEVASFKG